MPNYARTAALAMTLLAGALPVVAAPAGAAMTSAIVAQSPPAPAMSEPPENPLVTKRVSDAFNAWQSGHIDRTTYSPTAGGIYDDAFVAVVAPDLKAVGPQQSIRYRTASLLLGDVVYRYDVTGASGVVSVLYSLDPNGKTDGVVFTPQIFRSSYLSS